MQRIWKELDESNSNYEDNSSSNKKRTPKFVGEIQAMIDNNPSKLIRSMVVSEFLIRQVVFEDIWYFLYKMRKGQFSLQVIKDKKKDHTAKPGPDGELTEIPLACSVPTRCTNINENQTPSLHHNVVMPLFIFPYGLRLNMEANIKYLEKVVLPWIERVVIRRTYVLAVRKFLQPCHL